MFEIKESIQNKHKMKLVDIDNQLFYEIENSDKMRPFFITLVSHSNHWLFISSNGALTAGRKNSDFALFPYYTDDKITESAENTGSKTIVKAVINNRTHIWEPFSFRNKSLYNIQQNLYKSIYGNEIIFEEINKTLQLTFRYKWSTSNMYGFVKKSSLINHSETSIEISVVDGFQNIIPAGVGSNLQSFYSNLVDAYKRSELVENVGLGIYALSAIIVDRAEPSEALKANTVWSYGFEKTTYLLSSVQLDAFRSGNTLVTETDSKGEKGCYFVNSTFSLQPQKNKEWYLVANVNQTHNGVIQMCEDLQKPSEFILKVLENVDQGRNELLQLNSGADGIQKTADQQKDSRHFSNVLFNVMRGGIFDHNYQITKRDFRNYLKNSNKSVFEQVVNELDTLPNTFDKSQLESLNAYSKNLNFQRLAKEYLPLYFSRRHGDPSRPWNHFSINTQSEIDGSRILDYQGNWRDIFQNWEALSYAYPDFIESMLFKFLNATTFEGYNPYRVTKDGFDWETVEPDNPWSYIGYWGDHQIIYLLKFLEFIENYKPKQLSNLFDNEVFVYANVPYKIKSFEDIVANPKDTIAFDEKADEEIREKRNHLGADATLLFNNETKNIHHVNFIEKLLATTLSKISNLIPEGGIWMNTQRPEWNDANNALVGNGVSMVTLYYLRRFMVFFEKIAQQTTLEEIKISQELVDFYKNTRSVLEDNANLLQAPISNENRLKIVEQLGQSASSYRWQIYNHGFWGKKRSVSINGLKRYISLCIQYIDHSIKANKRNDNLYHAYNLATFTDKGVSISYLSEMLEGQVAVLTSGLLSGEEANSVLKALRNSSLYRQDQNSYILYPNKDLLGFLQKNTFSQAEVEQSDLLKELVANGNNQIISSDIKGNYHFNGNFKNSNDLNDGLQLLEKTTLKNATEKEFEKVAELYEKVFNHKEFTGRSGTFYGYEGLGSIYWHMVSKLALAVSENLVSAHKNNESKATIEALTKHYYEIVEGIGVHKSPQQYGAFPTDAYSHTPSNKGAQQPGMTGQVKEDILCRWSELGIQISNGTLCFDPFFLNPQEFSRMPLSFNYYDVNGQEQLLKTDENSLAFTFCQVPFVYQLGNENKTVIHLTNGEIVETDEAELPLQLSQEIFNRSHKVKSVTLSFTANNLRPKNETF